MGNPFLSVPPWYQEGSTSQFIPVMPLLVPWCYSKSMLINRWQKFPFPKSFVLAMSIVWWFSTSIMKISNTAIALKVLITLLRDIGLIQVKSCSILMPKLLADEMFGVSPQTGIIFINTELELLLMILTGKMIAP